MDSNQRRGQLIVSLEGDWLAWEKEDFEVQLLPPEKVFLVVYLNLVLIVYLRIFYFI